MAWPQELWKDDAVGSHSSPLNRLLSLSIQLCSKVNLSEALLQVTRSRKHTFRQTGIAASSLSPKLCSQGEHGLLLTDRGWAWEVPHRQVVDIS